MKKKKNLMNQKKTKYDTRKIKRIRVAVKLRLL